MQQYFPQNFLHMPQLLLFLHCGPKPHYCKSEFRKVHLFFVILLMTINQEIHHWSVRPNVFIKELRNLPTFLTGSKISIVFVSNLVQFLSKFCIWSYLYALKVISKIVSCLICCIPSLGFVSFHWQLPSRLHKYFKIIYFLEANKSCTRLGFLFNPIFSVESPICERSLN